jgi:hypothetical protein
VAGLPGRRAGAGERLGCAEGPYHATAQVMRVAELLPEDTLQLADTAWRQAAASFLALEQQVTAPTPLLSSHSPSSSSSSPSPQLDGGPCPSSLEPLLRDHSTLLQLAGRLCPLYLGAAFLARLAAGLDATKQLLELAAAGARLRLWARPDTGPATARALVQCQAHTLAALQVTNRICKNLIC